MPNFEGSLQRIEDDRGNEHMERQKFTVVRLTDGLGFGKGTISGKAESDMSEIMDLVDQTIENSPDILVPVGRDAQGNILDDDGCGDGRGVFKVFKGKEIIKQNLNRAKVFGGGLVAAVASKVGLGLAKTQELNDVFSNAQADMALRGIEYGAHIDTHDHEHDDSCGCGAIDKMPQAIENTVEFKQQIRSTVEVIDVDTTGLDEVEREFENYAAFNVGKPYSGRKVMDGIIDSGKVVKQLDGDHREKRFILNMVEGMTVNQELIRAVSNGLVQVFVTDGWRLKQIADRLYPGEPDKQHKAFLSSLSYSLGVAGTLTPGDLPVYIISPDRQLVAA